VNAPSSLYIHIPFCAAFCDYCDFYSILTDNVDGVFPEAFIKALITDINYQIDFFGVREISTVYIGGGTPSILGKHIAPLFSALKSVPGFSPVEFTVEANPETADEEFLDICREGGVNRLSLGVQSFHEPSRRAVNRIGEARLLEKRLALCSRYFPGALSADLITGLPYQDEKIVLEDIKRLLAFEPVHVSLYSLTLEGGTPLEEKVKTKTVTLQGMDEADSLWLSGRDALLKKGYQHYEVSNFALSGKRCLHNTFYWQMRGWLGAGPSASGTLIDEEAGTGKRFTFAPDVDGYIKEPSIHAAICEELDSPALMHESLLMGFRCAEGPDRQLFKERFGCNIDDRIGRTLSLWKDRDIMLFLNAFLRDAFAELEEMKSITRRHGGRREEN
jgi:oxygen-independent coproporphyrinogen-3 oxidase